MTKIAVIKLGARIPSDATVTSGEALSICRALARGGAEVTAITKILKKDVLDPNIKFQEILDDQTSDADILVVVNGNVNYFGGQDDPAQTLNYKVINQFKGKIIYVMCDPELQLKQVWGSIEKKDWKTNYVKDDILITRKDIVVMSQAFDVEAMQADWESDKNNVQVNRFFHFPMERFPFLNPWLDAVENPVVDLLYGGTPRSGRRIPNLYKWYCGLPTDISVELFGTITENDFVKHPKIGKEPVKRYPNMTGKVKYTEVLPKMNNALAHLVTGDPIYDKVDLIPQRVAECIAAGNIVFVDAGIDRSRRIYPPGTQAHDFLYVAAQDELVEKIRLIKSDPLLRAGLIHAQRDAVAFDALEFCKSMVAAFDKV